MASMARFLHVEWWSRRKVYTAARMTSQRLVKKPSSTSRSISSISVGGSDTEMFCVFLGTRMDSIGVLYRYCLNNNYEPHSGSKGFLPAGEVVVHAGLP